MGSRGEERRAVRKGQRHNLYFETYGAGRPLILLHGGLGSGEMFGPILPALGEHHQVITVNLQGHGRTADIDHPIDMRLPGLTHYNIFGSPLFGAVTLAFLDQQPG